VRALIRPALFALWSTAFVAITSNLVIVFSGPAANGSSIVVNQQA